MSLCTDDVFRIAKLARLELDAGEAQATLDKLNGIFGLIEKMQAVDTTGVEPLYKPQAVAQRLRDDVVTESGPSRSLSGCRAERRGRPLPRAKSHRVVLTRRIRAKARCLTNCWITNMSEHRVAEHFSEALALLQRLAVDKPFQSSVAAAAELLVESFKAGGKVISCGNGGSHCDAMHFAEELSGRYRENRPALPAMAVSDVSHITCVGNDYGFDQIFARHVEAFGREGDVLLGYFDEWGGGGGGGGQVAQRARRGQSGPRAGRQDHRADRQGRRRAGAPRRCRDRRSAFRAMPTGSRKSISRVIHTLIDLIERGLGYTQA